MRNEPNLRIEKYRQSNPPSEAGANHGLFQVGPLRVISSGTHHEGDHGWEHVSVSRQDRIPTWEEMQQIKEMFFQDEETVLQFHPKKSEYVNFHPRCLHLWRPCDVEIALPPKILLVE